MNYSPIISEAHYQIVGMKSYAQSLEVVIFTLKHTHAGL